MCRVARGVLFWESTGAMRVVSTVLSCVWGGAAAVVYSGVLSHELAA